MSITTDSFENGPEGTTAGMTRKVNGDDTDSGGGAT